MSSGVKPHNFKMNCDSSKYISSLSSTCYYSEIRCIALCVLQILGFSVPSIILADLLGNMFTWTSWKGHGLWFEIGGFRSVLFVSVFKVCCLVIVLFRAIIIDWLSLLRRFFWSFSVLLFARIKQRLPPSFDKKSTHHCDFLRYSWAV